MSVKKVDFPIICRLCLIIKEEMLNLEASEMIQMIEICVDIEIDLDDELPKSVCSDCADKIYKYSSFRNSCKKNDKILHKIVESENDYFEENESNKSVSGTDDVDIKEEFEDDELKKEPYDSDIDIKYDELKFDDDYNTKDSDNNSDKSNDTKPSIKSDDDDGDKTDYEDIETMLMKVDKNSKKVVYCKVCGKKMLESTLFGHLRRHQQGKKHKCDKCPKAYREPCELAKHLQRVHHIKGDIECHVCQKTFQIQAQLDFHLKRHFKKKYPCDICGKECFKSAKLKRHKEIHQKREKSFFCLKCDSTFLREISLKLHVKKYHSETPHEKQACSLCGKFVYNVRLHTLHTHSNVRPHKCDQCEKAYTFKSVLLKHIREKHLGIQQEYKALCPTCGKACPSQGELKKHLRTHIDERQFNCHLCEKKYKSGDGLRNHLKVHAGVRPYICSYCSKGFHTNTILKNHLRTHTGERPFACHICGRAFTQKVSLRTHMKVHSA